MIRYNTTMVLKKMFTAVKKIAIASVLLWMLFLTLATPVHAQTTEWSGVCVGPEKINDNTIANDVATIQGFECLIGNVFVVIITVIGLAGFVMFIIAAFRYLLSGGNTKGTETARNTATFAVIGLVVALSGFIILNLLAKFTGIDTLTKFAIPTSDSTGDHAIYLPIIQK